MGSEVSQEHFSKSDFVQFQQQLRLETDYLLEGLANKRFSNHPPVAGFELEGCLVTANAQPAPINDIFLQQVNDAMFTPELAKFNIELNTPPQPLTGLAFDKFENSISQLVNKAHQTAHHLDAEILFTGILPTLKADHFCLANMSEMKRYHALNEHILKARQGQPLRFDIEGHQSLHIQHDSVMLEAAATSMQLHLQAPIEEAHHYYNASILASAPVMSVSGNSPFLFGNELWHETRIPVFEQAIPFKSGPQRVSFGSGFIQHIKDAFIENCLAYPVILPMLQHTPIEDFAHLSLHNGVIWRWNRPLVGFDPDGTPHIRIEHRIIPAGPTHVDMIANAAFFYGLTQYFAQYLESHDSPVSFQQAKNNFYLAARHGLNAKFAWGEQTHNAQALVLKEHIQFAEQGLHQLQIDKDSIDYYLAIIKNRVQSAQTGAVWQMQHLPASQGNMQQLTLDYFQLQKTGQPVHTWSH